MKISELKNGQSSVSIEAEVTNVGEVRSFNKFGRDIRVATAIIKDPSGSVQLSLWNQDIDKVKKGDRIKISNGFVKEYQGELQLTAVKFGKIEVTGKSEASEEESEPEEEIKSNIE